MRLLLSLSIFLFLFSQTQAQNLAKKESIKKLFILMHQDSLMIKSIDGITATMVKNMTKIFSDTTYSESGIDISKITQKLMERSLQRSKESALKLLNGDMVDIYDKYFTEVEIEDFSNFYKSTSGQKMLTQMPEITRDIMSIMSTKYQTDFQQSYMKDVQEITNEMIEKAKVKQQ